MLKKIFIIINNKNTKDILRKMHEKNEKRKVVWRSSPETSGESYYREGEAYCRGWNDCLAITQILLEEEMKKIRIEVE